MIDRGSSFATGLSRHGYDALRGLKALSGSLPTFDIDATPADPLDLFDAWLRFAIDHAVPEPHAMTLATVDEHGAPDARVVLLKRYDVAGWWFASSSSSSKGRQIAACPAASLTFYWPLLGRQIRIAGSVFQSGAELSAADFLARPIGSRAVALAGLQSQPGATKQAIDAAFETALARLEREPGCVALEWSSYRVEAGRVEFWQGAADRRHDRLLYTRSGEIWARTRLWP